MGIGSLPAYVAQLPLLSSIRQLHTLRKRHTFFITLDAEAHKDLEHLEAHEGNPRVKRRRFCSLVHCNELSVTLCKADFIPVNQVDLLHEVRVRV